MAAKMKKATTGKGGCLKSKGRLKKGWRWAKRKKGFCVPAKKSKKSRK
jgi:hypothetical protein